MSHSTASAQKFKSPKRVLVRSLTKSRDNCKIRARTLEAKVLSLEDRLHKTQAEIDRQAKTISSFRFQKPSAALTPASALPFAMAGHQFSAAMIALCCTLAKLIGLRATPKVLTCIDTVFQLQLKIPSRDAVRNWVCRNGVAILKEAKHQEDWVWLVDHSVQLGKMNVLVVLGIRSVNVPHDRALCHQDMTPLAILPSNSRNKETVTEQLKQVADKLGTPVAIHCDGAAEIREAANELKPLGFKGPIIDDIKHKVCNYLKRTLAKDPRFMAFETSMEKCAAFIQQTELEHLLPPSKKTKCRFMNLNRLLDWALMVQCQLSQPNVSPRLLEKLGWLNEFAEDIETWKRCRQLIGLTLEFANCKGLYLGSTDELTKQLKEISATSDMAKALLAAILGFYQTNEQKFRSIPNAPVKLPCSTEVLESAFGVYKTFQRCHQRGSFTSLLASFAGIFDQCTATKIATRFARIRNKDVGKWLAESGLCNSTQARRVLAYQTLKATLLPA